MQRQICITGVSCTDPTWTDGSRAEPWDLGRGVGNFELRMEAARETEGEF